MNRLLKPLPLLLMMSLLCVLGAFLAPVTEKLFSLLLDILLAFLFAIFVHESGHLLVGLSFGLKPEEMIVGPFRLLFTGRTLSFQPNKNWQRFGGTMRFSPRSTKLTEIARKWSWMALGGPAFSLLTALLILVIHRSSHPLTELFIWFSFALGAATLVPLTNGVNPSDGKLFMLLRQRSARAERLMAGVILQKSYLSEKRPCEWNSEVIASAARLLNDLSERSPEQLAEEAELRMYLYLHFADTGQPEDALTYIRPISQSNHPIASIPVTRLMIDSLYACHLLLNPSGFHIQGNAQAIVEAMPDKEPYSYHKAWAALMSVQGENEKAAKHLSQARSLLERWFKPFGTYHFEQAILSRIERLSYPPPSDQTNVKKPAATNT